MIENIKIQNDGYIICNSRFYKACDLLSESNTYNFVSGTNKLIGEIDSGNWAVSYLISMYNYRPKDCVIFLQPQAIIDNKPISLKELSDLSCYIDTIYPLFSGKQSVRKLVKKGLKLSNLKYSCEDIKNIFDLDNDRFERPLLNAGNEIFRSMAAIGFAYDKQIFCFPWLSKMRFNSFHNNLSELIKILEDYGKIVIVPIGE